MSEQKDKKFSKFRLVERDDSYEFVYQQLITLPENFSTDEFERLTTIVYKVRFDFDSIMTLFIERIRRRPSESNLFKKTFLASLESNHEEFERLYKILKQQRKLGLKVVSDD